MHHRRRSRRRDKRHMLPCGCCESFNRDSDHPDIDDNEICNGKPRKKKPRPKKDKCPVNRTHEWYKEWVEEDDWYPRWLTIEPRKTKILKATCIHCWKTKVMKRAWPPFTDYRTLRLPKRPVKF